MERPFMPTWNRVVSAIPDIFEQLVEAVELDHQEYSKKTSPARLLKKATHHG
jgi:glucosyl-3-phosphoglycerate synthase